MPVIYSRTCTGCGICSLVCEQKAIKQHVNEEGFLYYETDAEQCKLCGRCNEICPAETYQKSEEKLSPQGYIVQAEEKICIQSTAGGAFALLAREFLKEALDGKVCGVTLSGSRAEYIMISEERDLKRLYGAKYVEAPTEEIFCSIKEALQAGSRILFVGTPCKVAALRQYVRGIDSGLLTIDFVCHGVSSPTVFGDYYRAMEARTGSKIIGYQFFHKELIWNPTQNVLRFENGRTLIDNEYQSLHDRTDILRMSCYDCPYAEYPHPADITMGALFKAADYESDIDMRKGVSFVIYNSYSGRKLVEKAIRSAAFKRKTEISHILKEDRFFRNYQENPMRSRFFELYTRHGYEYVRSYIVGNQYDVILACNWSTYNYGAHMTHYALYRYLSHLGLEVELLEKPDIPPYRPTRTPELFRKCPYPDYALSRLYSSIEDMRELNQAADYFLVGSDQVWNYELFGHAQEFYLLSFTDDDKHRLSYATSFGSLTFSADRKAREYFAEQIRRFERISVRETSGVALLAEEFGVKAEGVLDPVFLLNEADYDVLIQNSVYRYLKNYLFAYIIWPLPRIMDAVRECSKRLGEECLCVQNAMQDAGDGGLPVLAHVKAEDWLFLMKNSDFIFADSFHATCFAILFRKPFLVYVNRNIDGSCRIYDLLELLELEDRIIDEEDGMSANAFEPIDYAAVYEKLRLYKEKSEQWLKDAFKSLLKKKERKTGGKKG